HVPGALEHVQVQATAEHPDMHPAVARRDRGLRCLAGAADLVLGNPRGDEVRPVAWQFGDLLHQVPELVELTALHGGEIAERAAVVFLVLPAPRTWYSGIHGETKCVRSPGSSVICSTRCRNWSNSPPSTVGK